VINKSLNKKKKPKLNCDKYDITPTPLNTIAADINLKHNLLADSNGKIYDDILKPSINLNSKNNLINNINQIVTIYSKPVLDRTEKEIIQYQKLLRTNESLIKEYVSEIVQSWKQDGVRHIVLEDLNFIDDSSYFKHHDIAIKYSRLSRLLRVGQIKHWISSIAEKQGIFTHFVHAAYTSQECSVCHYISSNNRKKQEYFSCTNPNCSQHGVKVNADFNAAKVIKNRLLNTNIRAKLGKDNVYSCSRTKPVYYKAIKPIIEQEYQVGVVTESFPIHLGLNKINPQLKSKKNCDESHRSLVNSTC
jgi:transposase